MSLRFSFSSDPGAMLPEVARQEASLLGDIVSAVNADEVGVGSVFDDCLRVEFTGFIMIMRPDGTFYGVRKKSRNAENKTGVQQVY